MVSIPAHWTNRSNKIPKPAHAIAISTYNGYTGRGIHWISPPRYDDFTLASSKICSYTTTTITQQIPQLSTQELSHRNAKKVLSITRCIVILPNSSSEGKGFGYKTNDNAELWNYIIGAVPQVTTLGHVLFDLMINDGIS